MKRLVLWLLISTSSAWAQWGNAYGFVGVGQSRCCGSSYNAVYAGVGAEAKVHKRVGVGVEAGALSPVTVFSSTLGLASLNGYYHLLAPGRKLDPFVTGGYAVLFRTGHFNGGDIGGGLNYWFVRHVGVRAEVRDHIFNPGQTIHDWGGRLGVTLR
jgi:hypothetical protein